ncbi:MAG: hypothetical protein IJH63_10210 [Methanobrevibacter sp.]|nr:hypothetical protein [Methanosphaera sp.]MBR0371072.1 hypothetical protein [Methanobrevibacter sp.]
MTFKKKLNIIQFNTRKADELENEEKYYLTYKEQPILTLDPEDLPAIKKLAETLNGILLENTVEIHMLNQTLEFYTKIIADALKDNLSKEENSELMKSMMEDMETELTSLINTLEQLKEKQEKEKNVEDGEVENDNNNQK